MSDANAVRTAVDLPDVGRRHELLDAAPSEVDEDIQVLRAVYRHVIVPAIRGGATVMDDVFDDDDPDESN